MQKLPLGAGLAALLASALPAHAADDAAASEVRVGRTFVTSDTPDFGPRVWIFDPATPTATIQSALDTAFDSALLKKSAQFGPQRYAFLFKPGRYKRWTASCRWPWTMSTACGSRACCSTPAPPTAPRC
ncbi:MAG: hypothetical protein ABJD97_06495 [Betaproteobacteria bacterium]